MTRYSYKIGDQINVVSGTGTLSSSGVNITGTTTNFNPEIEAGVVIHAAGYDLVIATVTDDTHCTVVTAPPVALSGASFTITSMTNIETLGVTPPRAPFKKWARSIDLGNGQARGLGRPSVQWIWGFLTRAQRNSLRTYCTGKSARVYIATRENDNSDAYVTYDAAMLWPDEEDRAASRRLSFTIQFRDLIAL